jgi:hypothetical protein
MHWPDDLQLEVPESVPHAAAQEPVVASHWHAALALHSTGRLLYDSEQTDVHVLAAAFHVQALSAEQALWPTGPQL